jgi:hypothetical protein
MNREGRGYPKGSNSPGDLVMAVIGKIQDPTAEDAEVAEENSAKRRRCHTGIVVRRSIGMSSVRPLES